MVNRSTPPFLFSACLLVGYCGHMRRVKPPPFMANAACVELIRTTLSYFLVSAAQPQALLPRSIQNH